MFDTQKIDSFFSGEKNLLDEEEKIYTTRRTKVVRFFKLFLPCLTALLLGIGVVLFDFDTNGDSTFVLADEERIYFEKFRMKNTVFEITEKDNQLSTLKAEMVEETEPGKKLYDLQEPRARTFDKGKTITLRAQKGKFDQNKKLLNLYTDVVGNYNKQMEVKTNSATYSFATEAGYGNEKVVGNGEKGHFEADKFTFDKKKGIITLIQNVLLKNDKAELRSPTKATLFFNDKKFVALKATIKKGTDILKGDTVTAHFKDMRGFEVTKALAEGHTEIVSDGKKAFAEVKGVTLEQGGWACFPDAPTQRGVKHLEHLAHAAREGYLCYVIFVIQMSGILRFCPNWKTHPAFAEALLRACEEGVIPLAFETTVTPEQAQLAGPVPVDLRKGKNETC